MVVEELVEPSAALSVLKEVAGLMSLGSMLMTLTGAPSVSVPSGLRTLLPTAKEEVELLLEDDTLWHWLPASIASSVQQAIRKACRPLIRVIRPVYTAGTARNAATCLVRKGLQERATRHGTR